MAKSIEPKLKKIGEYLKLQDETIFMIPEYQRPYSWEISQCDKLWQDITGYIDTGVKDSYFFGTIIINCQEHDTVLSLIDGQQRTTTFLLLLKALLVRVNAAIGTTEQDADSDSLFRGLKERRRNIMGILYKAKAEDISDKPDINADRVIYSGEFIIKNDSINEMYKTELQTILSSVDYTEAENNVIKLPRKQNDNKYTNYFRNFKFFYEKSGTLSGSQLNNFTRTLLDSCEVIEIKSWQIEQAINMFNSLNSDGLPLYDADIISAKLYAVAEKNRVKDEFIELWKQLKDRIAEIEQQGIADIDAVFMQEMYHERALGNEIITENGSINVTTPGLRRYFTEINKSILDDPIGLCNRMINLAEIWKKAADYPIMQVLLKFNANTKLFLASYFHRFKAKDITESDIKEVAECLLRLFTVMELVDVGYSSSQFKTFLFGEIVKLANENVNVSEIKADFNKHICNEWKPEGIKQYATAYEKNMLVYLNDYLFALETNTPFALGNKCDIEHIMPASGTNLDEIRKDAKIDSREEFDGIVNRLGNKILLEEKINRAIGNEWFRTKVSTKLSAKTGYVDSAYPIAKALVKKYESTVKPYWNKDDIEKATDKASERIVKFIFGL